MKKKLVVALIFLEIMSTESVPFCYSGSSFEDEIIRIIKPKSEPSSFYDGICPAMLGDGIDALRAYIRMMNNEESVISYWNKNVMYFETNRGVIIERKKTECLPIRCQQYDYNKNLNIEVPTTSSTEQQSEPAINLNMLKKTYNISMVLDSNNIDYRTDEGTSTFWTHLYFEKSGIEMDNCLPYGKKDLACKNKLYEIPEFLFGKTLSVEQNYFIQADGFSSQNEISFKLSPESQRLLVKKSGKWGIRVMGCNHFKLKIEVEWKMKETGNVGSKLALKTWQNADVSAYGPQGNAIKYNGEPEFGGTYTCYERKVTVKEIYPTYNMECNAPLNMNVLKFYTATKEKGEILSELKPKRYASEILNEAVQIKYSDGLIAQMLLCVGGKEGTIWSDADTKKPGKCSRCPDSRNIAIRSRNIRSTYCDMKNEENMGKTCCYECLPKFIRTDDTDYPPKCVRSCSKGFYFDGRGCSRCESGKFNYNAEARSCQSCSDLNLKNHYLGPGLSGCISCGSFAQVGDGRCVQCQSYEYVPSGSEVCQRCPSSTTGLAYRLNIENATCELCPAGTRQGNFLLGNEDECEACDAYSYSSSAGSLQCTRCPVGKISSSNRTMCVDCRRLPPFSEYYGIGCSNVRCNLLVSYQKGNPLNENGCVSCSLLGSPPVGTFRSESECGRLERCRNKPDNSEYAGEGVCEWRCMPGFYKNGGNTCVQCSESSGFSSLNHVYVDDLCNYDCKPRIYRDGSKTCNVPCTDLALEAAEGRLRRYSREYSQRQNYVHDVCGDDERIESHEIPALRRGRFAYIGSSGFCGDLFLNQNEECDDGNQVNGDGCSSVCKIEVNENFWDCEEIGSLCVRNCGWPIEASESWGVSLYGFVFPMCSGEAGCGNCTGKYYRDIVQLGGGERRLWMNSNLISCSCDGNIARQVTYAECTAKNKGCKECPSRHFYHDTRRECIECGSQCLPGFMKEPPSYYPFSKCLNSTEYRYSAIFNSSESQEELERKQALVGCLPCYTLRYTDLSLKRWLPNREDINEYCIFECYQDSTGLDKSNDAFCSVKSDVKSGNCSGVCQRCSVQKSLMEINKRDMVGKYLHGCIDIEGYVWKDCDSTLLPVNAIFSGVAADLTDPLSCPWECVSEDFYKYNNERCLRKITYTEVSSESHPCPRKSDFLKDINGNGLLFVCEPCMGEPIFPLKVWETTYEDSKYKVCLEVCEDGVSFNKENLTSGNDYACTECSEVSCEMGYYKRPCARNLDAECISCSGGLREFSEYVAKGSCAQLCKSGYFETNSGTCKSCSDLVCDLGYYVSHNCSDPARRYEAPICKACDTKQEYEQYIEIGSCAKQCVVSYIRMNDVCVKCDAKYCGVGRLGSCIPVLSPYANIIVRTNLDCRPCSDYMQLPLNAVFTGNGTCIFSCNKGYVLRGSMCVVETTDPDPEIEEEAEIIENERFNQEYAVREWDHS